MSSVVFILDFPFAVLHDLMKPSMPVTPPCHRAMRPAVLLLASVCLLPGAAAALLGSHRSPRANLTLTLGGRLLLSRRGGSENSLSRPPLDRDDPAAPSGHSGHTEAPQAVSSLSVLSSLHGRTHSPLTNERQSRRLPPEFLTFPVYRSAELRGRRQPALESPLAGQLVTTTAAPRGRKITPQSSPATRSAAVEMAVPAPPADCDAPGGPAARLAARCRALRQLKQQALQLRRQAAQRQAQRKLQRIIDLHLADVADSPSSRARRPAPVELKRQESSTTAGTTPAHPNSRQGLRGTLPTQASIDLPVEDPALLKARRVPPPLPTPRTTTELPPGKRRRQSPASVSRPLATGQPAWVPVRVSGPEAESSSSQRKSEKSQRFPAAPSATGPDSSGSRQEGGRSQRPPHRGADRSQRQSAAHGHWRTYSSARPNSIRTEPDKPHKDAISPLPTKPGTSRLIYRLINTQMLDANRLCQVSSQVKPSICVRNAKESGNVCDY